jgi:integrase
MGLIKRDGIYYAEFFNSKHSPTTKRYSLKTRNKRPASSMFNRMQIDLEEGAWDPWSGPHQTPGEQPQISSNEPLFADLVNVFLQSRTRLGRSPETIRTYSEVLHRLEGRIPDPVFKSTAWTNSIMEYVYDKSVSPATQSKRYGHIRTFTKWATKEGLISEDPIEVVEKPKRRQVLPKSISPDELDLICKAIVQDYRLKLQAKLVSEGEMVWRIPLFSFAIYTGMRASELARLRWKDIDVPNRLLSIYEQKNGHQQTIPLSRKAVSILEGISRLNVLEDDYVFHSPGGDRLNRSAKRFAERASSVFRHYRREVGLPEQLCFHSLRHGFCTALANAGKPSYIIQSAARHKDISTSLRYIHVSQKKLLEELDDVFS